MNTLNEIRFDDKDLFFNDNIVKTSILPQGTKDLKRNIKVQANSVLKEAFSAITLRLRTAA